MQAVCISNDFKSYEKVVELINNEKELVEHFNQNYINILENFSRKIPSSLGDMKLSVYSNHISIQKIKRLLNTDSKFDLPKPTASDINKISKSLDANKATGPDGIPAKFSKRSANVSDCHLSNIIACDISKNKYFKHAKTATVRPIFKKDDREKIKNERPVSLLNMFSKIYERVLHKNFTNYENTFLSKFISAYRKSYSTNHVLIRSIEKWKKSLDEKNFVGAVLTLFRMGLFAATHGWGGGQKDTPLKAVTHILH